MARYKNWFYVWKVLCKTNINRCYFVAIHPMDKATSGTEGQDQSRDTDECICNLQSTHMCYVPVQKNTSWHLRPISILRILGHVWHVTACVSVSRALALMGHERIFYTFPLCANSLPLPIISPWCRVLQLVNDEHYCHIMFTQTSHQSVPEIPRVVTSPLWSHFRHNRRGIQEC